MRKWVASVRRVAMVSALIFSVLYVLSPPVSSQAMEPPNVEEAGQQEEIRVFLSSGLGRFNLGPLNSRMTAHGYDGLPTDLLSLGGGGILRFGRVMLGGEGIGFFSRNRTQSRGGGFESSLDAGYGFLDLGYLCSIHGLRITTWAGIGGGGLKLRIVERSERPSLDEVLKDPERGTVVKCGGLLVKLAVHVPLFAVPLGSVQMVAAEEVTNYRVALAVSLEAGHVFAPAKMNWSADGVELTGFPSQRVLGPYVRVRAAVSYTAPSSDLR